MHFRKSILFLSLIGLMVLSSTAFALQSGKFTYAVSGGAVTITGYTGLSGVVIIPAIIDSMPVLAIGDFAFHRINYLTCVAIPDSVTSIGEGVFLYCTRLTRVTIGNSVMSIGNGTFAFCSSLTSIVVDASNTTYSSQNGVLYNKDMTTLITYPGGKSGGFTIPSSVTSIGNCAFYYCTSLTSVTIPDSVTSIGYGAFMVCNRLTKAYFLGNAPSMRMVYECSEWGCTFIRVFDNCDKNFTICYTAGSTGFTSPTWYGYPAAICEEPTTTTTTISSWSCAVELIYGENSEQTELLREYRDNVLSKTPEGQETIKTYYKFSPTVTNLLENSPQLKSKAKVIIDSMLPGIRKKVEESNKGQ
jgi:hypothetical protein